VLLYLSLYLIHAESCTLKLTALFLVQDDFLPRTATPLEDIFKSLFWYVIRSHIRVRLDKYYGGLPSSFFEVMLSNS
jgi:hypothetical protein